MNSLPFCRRLTKLRSVGYYVSVYFTNLLKKKKFSYWKELHICAVHYSKKHKPKKPDPREHFPKRRTTPIEVWCGITIPELANSLNIKPDDLRSIISSEDYENFVDERNESIGDIKQINRIIRILGRKHVVVKPPGSEDVFKQVEDSVGQPPSKPENLVKRPPVVTIMGHVDHGKTTLLDALRNSFIVNEEFGGITQHIGAFSVEVKPGRKIVFIDTPGHAAFTSMRSRGVQVTDLVVLVIAADDGIMQQTLECLKIINRACVRMIVAINKIDKVKKSDLENIKDMLLQEGIQVETRGGDIQVVPISALKKINLDLLLDSIFLEAEMMDLKGDPTGLVEGVVIESKAEDKVGHLATVLIKRGTLKKGKILVAGKAHGRVRIMTDERGNEYKEATPSTPVRILGWKELPSAGDEAFEVTSEKQARKIISHREKKELEKKVEEDSAVIQEKKIQQKQQNIEKRLLFQNMTLSQRRQWILQNFLDQNIKADNEKSDKKINIILKGDTDGTLEVLLGVLTTYNHHDECELAIVDASVGNITQKDIDLAETFDAKIYSFNIKISDNIKDLIASKNIDVHSHNVIYKLVDDLKEVISEKIPPADEEEIIGEAQVNQNFFISQKRKKIPVAGCKCISGELQKDSLFKVIRGENVIFTGKLIAMKHLKEDVTTIPKNSECGLMFDSFDDEFQPGDKIICFKKIKIPRCTSWNPGF